MIPVDPDQMPTVHWLIFPGCNYRCSYCKSRRKPDPDLPSPRLFLDGFARHLPGTWLFNCAGAGEPFQAPEFVEIIRELVKMGHLISTITNFSAPLEQLLEFCEITRGKLGFFNASLHLERADLKEFLQKALSVKRIAGDSFTVCSVARKGRLPRLEAIARSFHDKGIRFLILPEIVPTHGGPAKEPFAHYSDKEWKIINKNRSEDTDMTGPSRVCGPDAGDFKGQSCLAGKKWVVIDERGEAWRCFPAHSDRRQNTGYLGNPLKGTFKLKTGPLACPYERCYCPTPDWIRASQPRSRPAASNSSAKPRRCPPDGSNRR